MTLVIKIMRAGNAVFLLQSQLSDAVSFLSHSPESSIIQVIYF